MSSIRGAGCSFQTFLRFVLPSVAAMLLFSLYTVADAIFLAWGVGAAAMTSVNIALPFINGVYGLSVLLSMGTATLVAFARGRGDQERANALFSQTVLLLSLVGLLITVLVTLFSRQLALLLGADGLFLEGTAEYLRVSALFTVCFLLSYCMEVMVKVDNRPGMAVVGVAASFLLSLFFDYLFILVFGWGITGAGLATGLSQLAAVLVFLLYFRSRHARLKLGRFRAQPRAFLRILPLGVADCSVELIAAFLTILYNQLLLHSMGASGQTLYALVAYLNLFAFMLFQGITQGMMHLVSFHMGRGEGRVASGYFRMALLVSGGMSLFALALSFFAAPQIAGWMLRSEPALIPAALTALRLFSLSFPFASLNIAFAGYLSARERALPSTVLALSRGFFFAPLALFFCVFLLGGNAVWCAALLGEFCCLLLGLPILRAEGRKMRAAKGEKKRPRERDALPLPSA